MNKELTFKVKNYLLDLIFPKYCLGCGREGDWLCPTCLKKIVFVKSQTCPGCGRLSQDGKFCPRCLKPHGLRGIVVACYFEEGPIRELIHNFKYNHILELGNFLGKILAETLKENFNLKENILIVPVPLYWLRENQRGYNQAEILAREVSKILQLPFGKILLKKRGTKRQVDLKGRERRSNLKKVFQIKSKIDLTRKTVILVDDITTTGTTLQECAKILRQAGAKRVWGLVVARG